jgi:hypothetical protein
MLNKKNKKENEGVAAIVGEAASQVQENMWMSTRTVETSKDKANEL